MFLQQFSNNSSRIPQNTEFCLLDNCATWNSVTISAGIEKTISRNSDGKGKRSLHEILSLLEQASMYRRIGYKKKVSYIPSQPSKIGTNKKTSLIEGGIHMTWKAFVIGPKAFRTG